MKKYVSIVLAIAIMAASISVLASCVNPILDTSKLAGIESETERTILENESSKSYFTYEISKNDKITITAYSGGTDLHDIVVPEKIGEREVTAIAADAFKGQSNVKSVTLPKSVTSIGNYAFSGCYMLQKVTAPSVSEIGVGAFYNCNKLTDFDNGTERPLTSIGKYAFFGCESLANPFTEEACEGSSLKTIGDYAFYGCNALDNVHIPKSVEKIGSYAFYNCSSLTSVYLGDTLKVTQITDEATGNILETIYPIGERAFTVSTALTVSCVEGSYAHTYAAQNFIKYVFVN